MFDIYTMQEGDTIEGVACKLECSVDRLVKVNRLDETFHRLVPGDKLIIPDSYDRMIRQPSVVQPQPEQDRGPPNYRVLVVLAIIHILAVIGLMTVIRWII